MTLFVDTCVWSLAFRRDAPPSEPHVERLAAALRARESIVTTGIVLQELLQGFAGPKHREAIIERLAPVPLLVPSREDHIEAAGRRNACRQKGVQLATVDALLAQLCIRHELLLLTTDRDFTHAAEHLPLALWTP